VPPSSLQRTILRVREEADPAHKTLRVGHLLKDLSLDMTLEGCQELMGSRDINLCELIEIDTATSTCQPPRPVFYLSLFLTHLSCIED
jgi:hypothetical protein